MAYVHCHGCGWEQDDFWDFGFKVWWPRNKRFWSCRWQYNPFSNFWRDLKIWWKPQYTIYDQWLVDDLGWKSRRRHSWQTIGFEFKKMCRRLGTQRWWTWKQYKRSKDKKCPKCGHGLCID